MLKFTVEEQDLESAVEMFDLPPPYKCCTCVLAQAITRCKSKGVMVGRETILFNEEEYEHSSGSKGIMIYFDRKLFSAIREQLPLTLTLERAK